MPLPQPDGERAVGSNTGSHARPAATTTTTTAAAPREPAAPKPDKPSETITLLGRKLSPAEFNTAMVHFYRGEVQRSNTWRNRLDTTTNWAVITAGATLSFAFSSPANPHFVILINSLLVAFFLVMEARRYRYYEIWASRVRVIETGYFAQMLTPEHMQDAEWVTHLANDLRTPHFTISEWEAIGRRLRRNYLWIFVLLAASWNLKVYLHPTPALDFDMFLERAGVGVVPGGAVFLIGVLFNLAILVFAFATVRLREATGEVLPVHEFPFHPFRRVSNMTRAAKQRRAATRRTDRARTRTRTMRVGSATGEWKRPDADDIHRTETEAVPEETLR